MNKLLFLLLLSASTIIFGCVLTVNKNSQNANQQQAWQEINSADALIDVRTAEEFASGHLENAKNISHELIADQINTLNLKKDDKIVLYCRSGRRAELAKESLNNLGYTNVVNVGGYADLERRL